MKKRNISIFSMVLALVMLLSISAAALVPGDELDEVKVSPPAAIDQSSPGKPVDVMDDLTGVSVVVSANVLPAGVTSVALETSTVKKEAETASFKTVTEAVTKANVSKESEQIAKNYDITPVSAIVLNLVDKSNANSTEKKVITELDKPVDFTVPVPDEVNAIAYVDPKTGELVIIEGKVKNGFMTFSTNIVGVQFILLTLTKK